MPSRPAQTLLADRYRDNGDRHCDRRADQAAMDALFLGGKLWRAGTCVGEAKDARQTALGAAKAMNRQEELCRLPQLAGANNRGIEDFGLLLQWPAQDLE